MRRRLVFAGGTTAAVSLAVVVGVLEAKVGRSAGEKRSRVDRLLDQLLPALIQVESSGNDRAVGDKHLGAKAYGCLQIRQPYLDDVNQLWGTKYCAKELLGNRDLSLKVARAYLKRYATRRLLGHEPSLENLARIHNGGPSGWKRASTRGYWVKVQKVLNRSRAK